MVGKVSTSSLEGSGNLAESMYPNAGLPPAVVVAGVFIVLLLILTLCSQLVEMLMTSLEAPDDDDSKRNKSCLISPTRLIDSSNHDQQEQKQQLLTDTTKSKSTATSLAVDNLRTPLTTARNDHDYRTNRPRMTHSDTQFTFIDSNKVDILSLDSYRRTTKSSSTRPGRNGRKQKKSWNGQQQGSTLSPTSTKWWWPTRGGRRMRSRRSSSSSSINCCTTSMPKSIRLDMDISSNVVHIPVFNSQIGLSQSYHQHAHNPQQRSSASQHLDSPSYHQTTPFVLYPQQQQQQQGHHQHHFYYPHQQSPTIHCYASPVICDAT